VRGEERRRESGKVEEREQEKERERERSEMAR